MHEKPGTSNACDYRVLYSFTMIDSFRGGESHNYTKAPGCFICSTGVVMYIRWLHIFPVSSQYNILALSNK